MEAINSRKNYMQIYFPLAKQFTTQTEPAFCGLATLTMSLNALQIDPGRLWKGPWRWFSEELFDCCMSLGVAKEKGINLSEFICLSRCYGVLVEDYRATSEFSLEQVRDLVKRSCASSSEIVVLNYSRQVLGQTGDGHFSPIGGYHAERDMSLDPSMDLPRGLVILKEGVHTTRHTLVKQQLGQCAERSTVAGPSDLQPCCYCSSDVEVSCCVADPDMVT
ncbi:unnamed protein product [Peronospora belbahrii]|uniref:glutathione gamma-glutamylcysteinyltransferase n=1 Tax=Peronospora belbahrii TaxID=622444 RepID=A0AAU9L410_9STRA|nr:unnamed protein product [Peronospora belbahrii]